VIKIIDNFFEDKSLLNIQDHITTKLIFTPQYFENAKERNKESHYGDRFDLENDMNLLNTFVKQTENKFKIKINKVRNAGIDIRNLDSFKPHTDIAKINVFIMLKGPTAVTNGTVFYTQGELDIHVGFRENRAILFPSNWVHSPHRSKVKNLKRYSASLFIEDYKEE
jgi:hypothetical protein